MSYHGYSFNYHRCLLLLPSFALYLNCSLFSSHLSGIVCVNFDYLSLDLTLEFIKDCLPESLCALPQPLLTIAIIITLLLLIINKLVSNNNNNNVQ